MRILEWLIVLLLLPAGISTIVLEPYWPAWLKILVIAGAILIPIHAWVEGIHWQMFPTYAAAGLLLLLVLAGLPAAGVWAMLAGGCATGLLACTLAFSWALPMFRLPEPTGKYPVGTRLFHFVDPVREEIHPGAAPGRREVMVQLWYPSATSKGRKAKYRLLKETSRLSSYQAVLKTVSIQDAPVAEGRHPVLIFNHAWNGFRNRNVYLAQELASHGFMTASISHPYNCAIVAFPDGRVSRCGEGYDLGFAASVYMPLEERLALADWELRIQTDDCHLTLAELVKLDRTPGSPIEGHVNLDAVGTYGWSYGAGVAAEFARENDLVGAALELDGVLHGKCLTDGLNKPLMFLDSVWLSTPKVERKEHDLISQVTIRMWQMIVDAKDATLKRFGGYRVVIDGVVHDNFADVGFMSPLRRLAKVGALPHRRGTKIICAYTLAFFRETLLKEPQAMLEPGSRPFPEAAYTRWPGSAVDDVGLNPVAAGSDRA